MLLPLTQLDRVIIVSTFADSTLKISADLFEEVYRRNTLFADAIAIVFIFGDEADVFEKLQTFVVVDWACRLP